jgi:hypothetical protein
MHLSFGAATLDTLEAVVPRDSVTSHSCSYVITHTAEFRHQVTTREINLQINIRVQNKIIKSIGKYNQYSDYSSVNLFIH